jgi:hypothetical protein
VRSPRSPFSGCAGSFSAATRTAANNVAIQRQFEVMQRSAEHAEVQTRAIAANELHARQDTFIDARW